MTELNYKEIGKRIKSRRKELSITQEQIAEHLDVNPSHISNIESGRSHPSLTSLINIANILQCSIDLFICEEYTYISDRCLEKDIIVALQKCSPETKDKILKIIDIL